MSRWNPKSYLGHWGVNFPETLWRKVVFFLVQFVCHHSHKHMNLDSRHVMIFTCMMFYWMCTLTLTLIIVPFLSCVTFSNIKLTSILTWDMFCKCWWYFVSLIVLNTFTLTSSVLLGIHILTNRSSTS